MRVFFMALFWLLIVSNSLAFGAVWYVDGDMLSSGNGTTWSGAVKTIREAVDASIAGDEIWVKKGTYVLAIYTLNPHIIVDKAVGIYGGFAGGELREVRRIGKPMQPHYLGHLQLM